MSDAFNPYQSPEAPLGSAETETDGPRRRFRWRVIPAQLSLIVGGVYMGESCLAIYWLYTAPWPQPLAPPFETMSHRHEVMLRAGEAAGIAFVFVGSALVLAAREPYMKAQWRRAFTLSVLGIAIMAAQVLAEPFASWFVGTYLYPR